MCELNAKGMKTNHRNKMKKQKKQWKHNEIKETYNNDNTQETRHHEYEHNQEHYETYYENIIKQYDNTSPQLYAHTQQPIEINNENNETHIVIFRPNTKT